MRISQKLLRKSINRLLILYAEKLSFSANEIVSPFCKNELKYSWSANQTNWVNKF